MSSGHEDRAEIARTLSRINSQLLLVRQNVEHERWSLAAQRAANLQWAAAGLESALERMATFGDLAS